VQQGGEFVAAVTVGRAKSISSLVLAITAPRLGLPVEARDTIVFAEHHTEAPFHGEDWTLARGGTERALHRASDPRPRLAGDPRAHGSRTDPPTRPSPEIRGMKMRLEGSVRLRP
jgi:hypothetical protein